MVARFFGYGSLVNRATHDYPGAQAARLLGWRRVWVHVATRPVAFLSVRPVPGAAILGLVAEVPGGDWAALDLREAAYARHGVTVEVAGAALPAQIYAVPAAAGRAPVAAHPVLLSYLDAVVQGFGRAFGAEGVQDFFATTEGWDAPVLDDRASPRYPRAQDLTRAERAAVDAGLASVGARVIRPA
ncbi:MAG: gamma-glutamylcyclotransferase family protein [Gemmobacter sp.]